MILFSKKNRSITGIRNSAIQLTSGFLTALAYCLVKWISGSAPEILPPDGEWIPVLILGLVNTGFGCYLYFQAYRRYRPRPLPYVTISSRSLRLCWRLWCLARS